MDFGLEGKKAFVAGGGRGIGKAIARVLAGEGCDLVVAARTKDQLDASAAEIARATGRTVIPMVMDATSTEQVNEVVAAAASALGGLHILVNSASHPGGAADAVGYIETINEDSLINDFDIKFVGALRCARAAIPLLKKQGWGRIINISGGNARRAGNLTGGARNVSLVHMTKTLSNQLGQFGITVNCIHPGPTRTERTAGMLADRAEREGLGPEDTERPDFFASADQSNAIGRMIDAEELGYVAAFLASDKAWAVTGEVIAAGGGEGSAVFY